MADQKSGVLQLHEEEKIIGYVIVSNNGLYLNQNFKWAPLTSREFGYIHPNKEDVIERIKTMATDWEIKPFQAIPHNNVGRPKRNKVINF